MKRLIFFAAALFATLAAGASELHVMSFNMRYDNPEDGANNWRFRRDRVARVVTDHKIDVVGTQELLANQFDDLKARLKGYEAVGVGRENGKRKGEFCAVFFRKDRFSLLASGTFWLSATPEVVGSKGWDGACERVATWAVLRDTTGEEFLFVNTHLDHRGREARKEGVTLLMRRIAEMAEGREVILTGDFNARPDSEVIAHVVESGVLRNTKQAAAETSGPNWSFSDFGEIPEEHRPLIDYIFVSRDVEVLRYEVLPDRLDEGYVSDHAPVMAVVAINKK